MCVRIIVVNLNRIMTIHYRPSFNGWNNGRFVIYRCFFFDPANKLRADNTFVNELLSFAQFSLCIPLRHAG